MSPLFIIFCCPAFLLVLIAYAHRLKPGITNYHYLLSTNFRLLNQVHAFGIIILLLPTLFNQQQLMFLWVFPDEVNIWKTIAFLISFGSVGIFPWRKFGAHSQKPVHGTPSPAGIIIYIILRFAFLVMYEWFFRGVLLYQGCAWLGLWAGLLISVVLYMLAHMFKTKKEMIGCIPLGVLLCALTLWWQSIWPAIIIHIQIAIVNEWPPLKHFFNHQPKQATI